MSRKHGMKLKRQPQDNNQGDGSATEGEDETDEVEPTEDIPASVLSPGIGKKTRSIGGIEDKYKGLVIAAKKTIENYTSYQKPLLTPSELLQMVQRAWDRANKESPGDLYRELPDKAHTYVCKDISSFECRLLTRCRSRVYTRAHQAI